MTDIEKILKGRKVVEAYQKRHTDLGEGKLGKVKHKDSELELAQGLEQVGLTIESLTSLEEQHRFELVPYSELRGSKFRWVESVIQPDTQKYRYSRFGAVHRAVDEGHSINTISFSVVQNRAMTLTETSSLEETYACSLVSTKVGIDIDKCRELGISIARQPTTTNVKSVSLSSEGDFLGQLYCPATSYRMVQYVVIAFLRNLGLAAEVSSASTVAVNGKNISSLSALKGERAGRSSFHIYSTFNHEVASLVFKKPAEEFRAVTTSLQNELGEVPAVADAISALKRVFTEDFAAEVVEGSYSEYELSLTAEIEKTVPEV